MKHIERNAGNQNSMFRPNYEDFLSSVPLQALWRQKDGDAVRIANT